MSLRLAARCLCTAWSREERSNAIPWGARVHAYVHGKTPDTFRAILRTAAGDLLQEGCEYLLILKKSRAFIQRNSWGVIWSQPNSWERCRILTHWLYILDLCIRYLAQQDSQCIGRKIKELLVWCVGVDKLCLAQKPSLAWNIPTAEGECWQQWMNVEHGRGKFFKIPPCDLLCLQMDDYLGFARFVWPSAFLKNDCIDSPYSAIQKGHEAKPWALREEECFCLLLCLVIVLKLLCLSLSKTSPAPRWWCIREKSSGARSIHFSLFLLSLADQANWKLELKSLRSVWPSSSHPVPAPVAGCPGGSPAEGKLEGKGSRNRRDCNSHYSCRLLQSNYRKKAGPSYAFLVSTQSLITQLYIS